MTCKTNTVVQGRAINFARGHFWNDAFSRGRTFCWKKKQVSDKLASALGGNLRFENLSWMLPRATENAGVSHMWPAGC